MRSTIRYTASGAALLGAAFTMQAAMAVEYAQVVSVRPVLASVPMAQQICSQGQQLVRTAPSGAGAIIGAIAGGVLGNSIGGGFGRAAATGLGVVAGSVVGNNVEANASPVSEVPVQRCQTVTRYETRTVGYDVAYDYAGQRYTTRMARDPGRQLAVNVQPAEGSGAPPAPAYPYADPGSPVPLTTAPPPAYDTPAPQPAYYEYAPVPPAVYVAPLIGFGIGYSYYGGYRGHSRWR